MRITPLDIWVNEKTCGDLRAYQLEKLNETLKTAQNSPYYKKRLPQAVKSLSDLTSLPTINAETIKQNGTKLVCTPGHEISRIVTLSTSGTTGEAKRIYFTAHDQELTLDYFAAGLTTITRDGGVTAILLPCERPDGVGDLISRALLRIPVTPIRCGFTGDLSFYAKTLSESGADSMIAAPVQALSIARYCAARNIHLNVNKILLSTDNTPRVLVRELEHRMGWEVFEHYGMTETGLGGAIDCDAHDGLHIRENDLLFEVLDENGTPLPEGEYGELTVTTLTRRGMPLIRYRTGDISRLLPGVCKCGSALKRLERIYARLTGSDVTTRGGRVLRMSDFDEVLLAHDKICDFTLSFNTAANLLGITVIYQKSVGAVSGSGVHDLLRGSGLVNDVDLRITVEMRDDILLTQNGKRLVRSMNDTP